LTFWCGCGGVFKILPNF